MKVRVICKLMKNSRVAKVSTLCVRALFVRQQRESSDAAKKTVIVRNKNKYCQINFDVTTKPEYGGTAPSQLQPFGCHCVSI